MSPDLAETVKRLKELAGKATPGPWGSQDGAYPHDGYVVITAPTMNARSPLATVNMLGDENEARADAAYIAAANPSAISSILDAIEGLERDNALAEESRAMLTELNRAHVKAALDSAERITSLESSLAEARKGARTAHE